MSKYYDCEKPYSLENWNTLVRDVNEILQNPPAASDCTPVPPIDEAECPHRWSCEDIETMREALIQTCPSISFDEELVMWKSAIIDEIEEAMAQAWCNCSADWNLGDGCYTDLQTSPYNTPPPGGIGDRCCGNLSQWAPCIICVGQYCMESYHWGEYYPCWDYNAEAPQAWRMSDIWLELQTKTYNWNYAWYNAKRYANYMETYQNYVNINAQLVDDNISAYLAAGCDTNPSAPGCSTYAYRICYYGGRAAMFQNLVDSYRSTFLTWESQIDTDLASMDALAQESWAIALGMQNRFPNGINWWQEADSKLTRTQFEWGKWFDPNIHAQPTDMVHWQFNQCGYPTDGHTCVWLMMLNQKTGIEGQQGFIRFTPNGYPYCHGNVARTNVRDYAICYYEKQSRFKCETIVANGCLDVGGNCGWYPWGEVETVWWGQSCCGGFCGWLWAPLPEPQASAYYCESFRLDVTFPQRAKVDHTDDQNEWRQKYINWYDDHPQYDNRHSEYC